MTFNEKHFVIKDVPHISTQWLDKITSDLQTKSIIC